jgi:hypothetical protein
MLSMIGPAQERGKGLTTVEKFAADFAAAFAELHRGETPPASDMSKSQPTK